MDHLLSRAERQQVHHVREWRSVDVHQPSASSLLTLSGALLLMSLALGVLALIVIAALPFLVLGALAWSARQWLRRRLSIGRRRLGANRRPPAWAGARAATDATGPTSRT